VDTSFLPRINNNNNEANIILRIPVRRIEIQVIMHRRYCYHSLISQGNFGLLQNTILRKNIYISAQVLLSKLPLKSTMKRNIQLLCGASIE
jgi:hypothetical protein